MRSSAVRLPNRFPVGTRFVIEGRGGRIHLRYLEFPDGRQVVLPAEAGAADEFPPPAPAPVCRPKIILPTEERTGASRIVFSKPGGVPPAPQPLTHPANRPWFPFGCRGLLFCGGVRRVARHASSARPRESGDPDKIEILDSRVRGNERRCEPMRAKLTRSCPISERVVVLDGKPSARSTSSRTEFIERRWLRGESTVG